MNRSESNFIEPKSRVIGFIVCWVCRDKDVTLKNLRDDKGKKTKDYACEEHYKAGRPEIGNQSTVRYVYEG